MVLYNAIIVRNCTSANPHDIWFENQSMQKRTKVYLRARPNTFITAAQPINKLSEHLLFWSLSWCTIVRELNNINITPDTSWTLSMIQPSESYSDIPIQSAREQASPIIKIHMDEVSQPQEVQEGNGSV
jgi:hypothetical protein